MTSTIKINFNTEGFFDRLYTRVFGQNIKYININTCIEEKSNDVILILTHIQNIINDPEFPMNIQDNEIPYKNGKFDVHSLTNRLSGFYISEYTKLSQHLLKIMVMPGSVREDLCMSDDHLDIHYRISYALILSFIECFDDQDKFYVGIINHNIYDKELDEI